MTKLFMAIAAAISLIATSLMIDRAEAMPLGKSVRGAADELNMIDNVQFIWGGRNYCWYDDGWNGPGWYWCGNYLVPGLGWGGALGWHGWHHGGFRGGFRGGRGGFRGGFRGGMRGGFRGGFRGGRRSDMLLKHDITLLGHLDNGLGFYRFSYNGSDKAYVGVMAQEVQKVMPDAVARGSDGYLRVFYEKLGVKFQTYDQWIVSGAHVPAGATVQH